MKLLERVTDVGFDALEMIAGSLSRPCPHGRANRRLFLSDAIVVDAVRAASQESPDAELLEMGRRPVVMLRCPPSGERVSTGREAEVAGIMWEGDLVIVHLRTPAPIEIESRPVLTFLANAVSTIFGGTSFAQGIYSYKVPAGATWDGRDAHIPFDISKTVSLPAWMSRTVPVVLDVAHDSNGLWLKFAGTERQFFAIFRFLARIIRDMRRVDGYSRPVQNLPRKTQPGGLLPELGSQFPTCPPRSHSPGALGPLVCGPGLGYHPPPFSSRNRERHTRSAWRGGPGTPARTNPGPACRRPALPGVHDTSRNFTRYSRALSSALLPTTFPAVSLRT